GLEEQRPCPVLLAAGVMHAAALQEASDTSDLQLGAQQRIGLIQRPCGLLKPSLQALSPGQLTQELREVRDVPRGARLRKERPESLLCLRRPVVVPESVEVRQINGRPGGKGLRCGQRED